MTWNNFLVWHLETTSGKRMRESFHNLQQLLEVLHLLLEAATGYRRGPQHDGKCSFYFNCYFFHTTPTNRDLRQKAVYFPALQSFTQNRGLPKILDFMWKSFTRVRHL